MIRVLDLTVDFKIIQSNPIAVKLVVNPQKKQFTVKCKTKPPAPIFKGAVQVFF